MENGDGRDWAELGELRPEILRYVRRRCRDVNDAEDVVQETLLRAARYRGSLTEPERLHGWVLRIAANVLRDLVRREARARGEEDATDPEQCPDADEVREPEPPFRLGRFSLERDEALRLLGEALAAARVEDRAVLRSFYAGRGSCRATADECGLAPSLVKVRLFRARERLRRELRRRVALATGPGARRSA